MYPKIDYVLISYFVNWNMSNWSWKSYM